MQQATPLPTNVLRTDTLVSDSEDSVYETDMTSETPAPILADTILDDSDDEVQRIGMLLDEEQENVDGIEHSSATT